MPRLSEEKVQCIETLLRMNKSYREIASQCGVSVNTVMRYAKKLGEQQQQSAIAEEHRSDDVVMEDVEFIMNIVRDKLDPKHPIKTKWVSDVSWWTHLILDFSKLVLPDVLKLLDEKDIDIRNPEVTARNAATKFRALKQLAEERAEKILEYENKVKELEGEVKSLQKENESLRKLIDEYENALQSLKSVIDDLRYRVRETLVYIVKYIPQALSPSERATYIHVLVPKLKELWGVEIG